MRVIHVGLFADTHTGSSFGLWPRDFTTENGVHKLTDYQAWMLDRFNETVECMPRLDVALFDGDTHDGENPLMCGRGTITPDPVMQAMAFIQVVISSGLRKKCRHMVLVKGTPYHEDKSSTALEIVGSELKCERWGAGNRYADQVFTRKIGGRTLNATHHQPLGFINAAGAGSRMGMHAAVAEADKGLPHVDIIVRAHTHRHWAVEENGRHIISLPCFSFITPHAIKKMEYYRVSASNGIGAVLLTIDASGVGVKSILHKPPTMEVLDLA